LGSALAAAKAGLVTGIYFAGGVAAFSDLVLLAFKTQVIAALMEHYTNCAGTGPSTQSGSAEYCFSALFGGYDLLFFLELLVLAFFFTMIYGLFFELLPGGFSYLRKSLLISMIMVVVALFSVNPPAEFVGSFVQLVIVVAAEVALALVMAVVQARLYRRFTREVEFQTVDSAVKIMIGKRDQAGKKRTYAVGATQAVEAVGEGKQFRGWLVSGGVTVDDSKSPRTNIHVNGDGLLKATAN
jgi:hypothetical protein